MACVEFGIVAIEPHAAAGRDAAELQLQSGFTGQTLLRGTQLGQQHAADTSGADQADSEGAATRSRGL